MQNSNGPTFNIFSLKQKSAEYLKPFLNSKVPLSPTQVELQVEGWRRISYGKSFILDKDTDEVVGVIRFTPFDAMDQESINEMLQVARHFEEDSKLHPDCAINAAHGHSGGRMSCIGYRKAMVHDEAFGIYKKTSGLQCDIQRWKTLRRADGAIHQTLGKLFKSLAGRICNEHQSLMEYLRLPYAGYGHTCDNNKAETSNLFTPQIAYTRRGKNGPFSNLPHRDNDRSAFTYGMWLPVDISSDSAAEVVLGRKQSDFGQIGGHFYNASYGFYIDFSGIDGVVECVWRGSQDVHGTSTGVFNSTNQYRLGCSAQINVRLARAVQKWWKDDCRGKVNSEGV